MPYTYPCFFLFFRLLNYACSTDVNLPNAEVLLNNEITWLKLVRVSFAHSFPQKMTFYLLTAN